MALDIAITEHGAEGRRVVLTGRLDTETAPLLDARVARVLTSPQVTALLFDLAALEYQPPGGRPGGTAVGLAASPAAPRSLQGDDDQRRPRARRSPVSR
jgi:hypothetical protein